MIVRLFVSWQWLLYMWYAMMHISNICLSVMKWVKSNYAALMLQQHAFANFAVYCLFPIVLYHIYSSLALILMFMRLIREYDYGLAKRQSAPRKAIVSYSFLSMPLALLLLSLYDFTQMIHLICRYYWRIWFMLWIYLFITIWCSECKLWPIGRYIEAIRLAAMPLATAADDAACGLACNL